MREILSSIESEWRRYKNLAERALEQTRDDELSKESPGEANSIAVILSHVAGNLKSRFTDFLTTDGEKPWRDRDAEFDPRPKVTRRELIEIWDEGWKTLFAALEPLMDTDLTRNRHYPRREVPGPRSAASFAGAYQLSCGPDRVYREIISWE